MALETTTYIDGLVATNPTSSDNVGDGDNHIRLTKGAIKQTFPAIAGAVTATHTAINSGVALANTATNLNTANAIVKRDASGNFVASQITATSITAGNITITGTVTGSLTGNASTASNAVLAAQAVKLQTARTIALAGDVTGTASFDGSANATITCAIDGSQHTHVMADITDLSAELSRIQGLVSGSAVTSASKWTTPRSISLGGNLSGSVSIDGSSNVTLTATVLANSHSHTIANIAGLQGALNSKLESTSNAATATKLQTARSISLGGVLSGSVAFDGSANVSISAASNLTTSDISGFTAATNAASAAGALAAYPVGAIFTSTVATSPSVSLGGTWVSFGAGRVLVGIDSTDTDFDTAQETGGNKTTTVPKDGWGDYQVGTHFPEPSTVGRLVTGSGTTENSENLESLAHASADKIINNVQPYIVVYMWKRTA
jgi:hypothetical protein